MGDNILTAGDSENESVYFGVSSNFDFTVDPCRKDVDAIRTSYKLSKDWRNTIRSARERDRSSAIDAADSCFQLPERQLVDQLLDAYFRRTHKMLPFVHEGDLRAEYESVRQGNIDYLQRLPWYGVMNMVLAYGCESNALIPSDTALIAEAPFVERAKDIITAHVLTASTLETVQALLLICNYLQSKGELHESWNLAGLLFRSAQSLGLHVNPSAEQFKPVERELRKRAWAGCLVLDRWLSLSLGRPAGLGAHTHKLDLPLEVDDQYIRNDFKTVQQPSRVPAAISFFVSTIQLSSIVSDVSTKLYLHDFDQPGTEGACYDYHEILPPRCNHVLSTVLLLDGQLQSWWRSVPHHLKQDSKSPNTSCVDLQSQRIALKAK